MNLHESSNLSGQENTGGAPAWKLRKLCYGPFTTGHMEGLPLTAGAESAAHQFLQFLGIPSALHRDFRDSGGQFAELAGRELHLGGSEIFFQPMHFGRARNRHNPRLLGEEPGEGDLSSVTFLC